MRVLWVGDAVVASGFARCTHAACDSLHAAGHEVDILGLNYHGDPHPYPYDIYPCLSPLDGGRDLFGVTRLPVLVRRLDPDVVVLLNDPWNVPGYLQALTDDKLDPLIIGWLAVDAKNQHAAPLNDLSHVVTWTDWAMSELHSGGYTGSGSVVPLGVDHSIYNPRDKAMSRSIAMPPNAAPDSFVVGVVGRNQPRKRLDLTLAYYADWVTTRNIDNVYLYLHVAPTGDRGCDILSLIKYHNLKGKVILASPDIGHGVDNSVMPSIYSAFDVYLTTTQGEGWGLPTLEAMACGVPCIVPDYAGLGDWARSAAYTVPCTSTALSAPLNSKAYTVGGVPDHQATVWALSSLYRDSLLRDKHSKAGVNLASRYPWSSTGEMMVKVIESVMDGEHEGEGEHEHKEEVTSA